MTQTVILTETVYVGGSALSAGTTQTLASDIAADLVARGCATPVGVPVWRSSFGSAPIVCSEPDFISGTTSLLLPNKKPVKLHRQIKGSSLGTKIVGFDTLTGYSVDSGATMQLVDCDFPEIMKVGKSIKITVPAGTTKSLFFPAWSPKYNPASMYNVVMENATVGSSNAPTATIYLSVNANYANHYYATLSLARYGKTIQNGTAWATGSGSPTHDTVGYGKISIGAHSSADAVVILHGVYCGGKGAKSVISIIDDDGPVTAYENMVPLANKYFLKCGFAIIPAEITRISNSQLDQLYAEGHDIIPHGGNSLSAFSTMKEAIADIRLNADYLLARGYDRGSEIYVYPGGVNERSINDRTSIANYLMSSGYKAAFLASGGHYLPYRGINRYILNRYPVNSSSVSATVLTAIDSAINIGASICLMLHGVPLSGASGDQCNASVVDDIFSGIADRINDGKCINATPSDALAQFDPG